MSPCPGSSAARPRKRWSAPPNPASNGRGYRVFHAPHISAASARLMSAMPLPRPLSLLLLAALAAVVAVVSVADAQTPAPATTQPIQLAPPVTDAAPQPATPPNTSLQIVWEVKNRFRLFREERDFKLHADY